LIPSVDQHFPFLSWSILSAWCNAAAVGEETKKDKNAVVGGMLMERVVDPGEVEENWNGTFSGVDGVNSVVQGEESWDGTIVGEDCISGAKASLLVTTDSCRLVVVGVGSTVQVIWIALW
jgi:hypothetical protein